jgi:hypothetical protein
MTDTITKFTIEIPTRLLPDIGGYLYTAADRADANDDYESATVLDYMMQTIEKEIK